MISSTARDLPEHREVVRNACLRQSIMPSMMEYWPAIDTDGIAASLKKVDEADIYIGVFAHRYGYVPKGKNVSVTEMEYNQAVKRGIPRLIFLIDEDHSLNISQIEIEAAAKLGRLKDRLKQERTVSFFKSPDDLGTKVIHSLSPYATSTSVVVTASPQIASSSTPLFDPRNYVFFVPYRSKGNQVVGRDAAIQAVRSQLVDGHRTAIGQTASFQGLGGLGKTQLAVEYAYLFRDHYHGLRDFKKALGFAVAVVGFGGFFQRMDFAPTFRGLSELRFSPSRELVQFVSASICGAETSSRPRLSPRSHGCRSRS